MYEFSSSIKFGEYVIAPKDNIGRTVLIYLLRGHYMFSCLERL